MSKFTLSAIVAALVCVAGTAQADSTISSSTLDQMGLGGLAVISDHDALSIRGMGYTGSKNSFKGRRDGRLGSEAEGSSFALVKDKHHQGIAGSHNSYEADGPYAASGENFSEATLTTTDIEIVDVAGVVKSVTNVWSIHVEAGGFSSAMSF